MNPVRAISREVAGAWRSLRYDLRRKRSAHPVVAPAGRVRQRLGPAAAGLVLIVLASGGLFAMVAGLLALLDPGRPPAGLPAHAASAPAAVSPSARISRPPSVPWVATSPVRTPAARRSMAPKPPVPTPAPVPTCACTAPPRPSPSASGTPTPSASPSPTDVSTPTPDPTPPAGYAPSAQRGADPGTAP